MKTVIFFLSFTGITSCNNSTDHKTPQPDSSKVNLTTNTKSETNNSKSSFVGTWSILPMNGSIESRISNSLITIKKINSDLYEVKCNGNCFAGLMEYRGNSEEIRANATMFGNSVILKYTYDSNRDVLVDQDDKVYHRHKK